MGKVVLRALTLFLFSELLTRAQTSGLERERGAPLSDTHANGRRLDSFFSGYFQRDDRDLAAICNNGDVCSFEAEIGGKTRQFVGSCRQRCNPDENHSEFQMNLIGSKSKMCDVVKGCNCKCCASAATKNTLEMLGYKCVASKDTDDCFCKYGGTCKETCLDNEKWQDKPELCSVNCKCCVPVKPPPHPMLPGDKGDPHYTTFDLFSYTHTGHNCTYILFKECVKYPSFIVATKYSSFFDKKGNIHSQVSDVLIKSKTHLIQLAQRHDVYVNGKHVSNSLPWTDGDQINIKQKDSRHIQVEAANKFSLSWNGFGNLVTEIDPSLYGKVCGLLGDADGNPDNDLQLQMPDGTLRLIDDGEKSGDSWMIPGSCNENVTAEEIQFMQK